MYSILFQNESKAVGVDKLIGRISVRRNGQALGVGGGGQAGLAGLGVYIIRVSELRCVAVCQRVKE